MIYLALQKIKTLAIEIGHVQEALADIINSNLEDYVSNEKYHKLNFEEEILHKQIEVLQELIIDIKRLGEK